MCNFQCIVMDTESTGFDAETNSLVELGYVLYDPEYPIVLQHYKHSLVKNTTPIQFGAMAAHHITEDDLVNAPNLDEVLHTLSLDTEAVEYRTKLENPKDVLVFHNAEHDRAFLPPHLQELPFICTWRCAVAIWPDAESHSNGALWYQYADRNPIPEEAGRMPHRALFDAFMTRDVLHALVTEVKKKNQNISDPIKHLIWLSGQPILLKKVRFGKHREQLWSEVPRDYLQWCLRQDMDSDIHFTCRFYLGHE